MSDASHTRSQHDARRQAALDFLLRRVNYERVAAAPYGEHYLKLDRMRRLLRRLGNPESAAPIVHVAGTKGKGSTSAVVDAVLREAGYKVGVYSSPHLENIEERFSIEGRPISPLRLTELVEAVRPAAEPMDAEAEAAGDVSLGPTFFELCTAMAFVLFAEERVDLIVLEVGLGGRLDSTNVCNPAVTAIVSISLDHMRQLGDATEQIAYEKGGIIKPGVPVLLGPLEAGPRRVLTDLAVERGSPVIEAGRDFAFTYHPPRKVEEGGVAGSLDFHAESGGSIVDLSGVPLGMLGRHQAANAALGAAVALELRRQGWLIPDDALRRGIAKARLPGRVEVIARRPTVVLDVAHNVASARALVASLDECFPVGRRTLIFAVSKDKDAAGILGQLLSAFQRVVFTEFKDNPRAASAEELALAARELLAAQDDPSRGPQMQTEADPAAAWQFARSVTAENELICVAGSFFIAAELRRLAAKAT